MSSPRILQHMFLERLLELYWFQYMTLHIFVLYGLYVGITVYTVLLAWSRMMASLVDPPEG